MLVNRDYPFHLKGHELDEYLFQGWFRMDQTVFTTHFLNFKDKFYSAVWLKINLLEYNRDKQFERLQKANKQFQVKVQKAVLTTEKEALFHKYRNSVSFEASHSLVHLLNSNASTPIFNTYEVGIYDNNKLIGLGFFDLGLKSAAGISSIYDPDYKKFSLGKYLIYKKLEYCKDLKLDYFYPGYFVPGYPAFDYKLSLAKDCLYYFNLQSQKWFSIQNFNVEECPLQKMIQKIEQLQKVLEKVSIETKIYFYDFFDANLVPELKNLKLFDFPIFLYMFPDTSGIINPIIVYNPSLDQFQLLQCQSVGKTEKIPSDKNHFTEHVLRTQFILASLDTIDEVRDLLLLAIENKI